MASRKVNDVFDVNKNEHLFKLLLCDSISMCLSLKFNL